MFVAFSVVLATTVIGPLVYFLYRFVFYLLDVRRRGKAVDQFPGEPRHWLWGHIHLVRTCMFVFIMIQLSNQIYLLFFKRSLTYYTAYFIVSIGMLK